MVKGQNQPMAGSRIVAAQMQQAAKMETQADEYQDDWGYDNYGNYVDNYSDYSDGGYSDGDGFDDSDAD